MRRRHRRHGRKQCLRRRLGAGRCGLAPQRLADRRRLTCPQWQRQHRLRGRCNPWLWIAVGAAALLLPSWWDAAHGLWQSDEFGHAPVVLVIAAWLFWRAREPLARLPDAIQGAGGWWLLGCALALFALGRTAGVSSVEFAAQVIVVASTVWLMKGREGLNAAKFPIFYLLFMVPLPGTLVDAVTEPLKHAISQIVVDVLHALGYPIGRSGVMITVGPYELLVADACSGLNSMFSLAALGALFIHLKGRAKRLHTALLIAAIVPIAFAANIVRVISLVLITYHFGDAAGQGFLHGAAGILLMVVALAAFFVLDALLTRLLPYRP
ncbi:MAG: exosortase B [Aquincola sp.]|nr:exosortase B [Aquincola sp.]